MRKAIAIAFAHWAFGSSLGAQTPQPLAPSPQSLAVYLITIGEGEYYWEKFGHNAIWFRDAARGIDVAYNWGVFDFQEPGYLGRVLRNDLRYWVDAVPAPLFIDFYRRTDRTVVIQHLGLTPEQAQKVYDYAQWNAREENKYYRYDYFLDNCSTRVRDLIDLALGGAFKSATASQPGTGTYRSETLRLVDDMKVTQFAINAALAQPADKQLTVWENMFVPSRVRDAIRGLRVPDSSGALVPVVAEERVVYESQNHRERETTPSLALPYLIIGLLLAAELFAIGWVGRRSGSANKFFGFEVALWALIVGILGVVLLLGWMITKHAFWYHNENLLVLNPLALFLVALAPMSLWRTRWSRPAAICAVIIAMLSALALVLKGLPWFHQDNVPMILLLLPPHFAVAHGLWVRANPALHPLSPSTRHLPPAS